MRQSSSMIRRRALSLAIAAAASCAVLSPSSARADEEQAKAYLGAAREDIKSGNFDSVERTLELFSDQLEGVDAGVVARLKAEAEAIRKDAGDKKAVAVFDDAEKALTKLEKDRDLARQIKNARENPKDEDAQAFLGGAVQNCKNFEDEFLKKLPAGNPRTKAVNDRYERFAMPILKLTMAAERDKTLGRLTTQWKQSSGEATAQFVDDPAMSYADWLKGTANALTSDRTRFLAEAAKRILDDEQFKSFETAFADDAEVKAAFAPIHAAYDEGVPKLVKEVSARVEGLEKGPPDQGALPRVAQSTRALAELAPANAEAVALNDRVDKVQARWDKAAVAADQQQQAKLEGLQKSADELWARLEPAYEGKTVDLDPAAALADIGSAKGKLVRFKDNVSTLFGAPDYAYVATVNGQPVAFRFNDRAKKAAAAYQALSQRPMSTNDFRDVVGRVVTTGKCNVIQYDNLREQWVTTGQVDCVVCDIVAFKHTFVTVGENEANTDALK